MYFCDSWHPLANKAGKVYHHRHVASVKAGRWLTSSEVAHHEDQNRANNEPDNLEPKDKVVHAIEHAIEMGLTTRKTIGCARCGRPFKQARPDIDHCSNRCAQSARYDIAWPSDKELSASLLIEPATTVATRLGITSNAIIKRCKARGIPMKPRGYWTGKNTRPSGR